MKEQTSRGVMGVVAVAAMNLVCVRPETASVETRRGALIGNNCNGGPPLAVAAGRNYACDVLTDGTAECWGRNERGQLGDGTQLNSAVPVRVTGLTGVTGVAVGDWFSCAVTGTGSVACWGGLGNGNVGLGDGSTTGSATPVLVSGIQNATAVTVGVLHACALRTGGKVSCWGKGDALQLGDPGVLFSATPVEVPNVSGAIAIDAGDNHTCALLAGGAVTCWGDDTAGQLGDDKASGVLSPPVLVNGLSNVSAISAGGQHTCATISNGSLYCWGWGGQGQLGDGTNGESHVPQVVPGLGNVLGVSAGGEHTCAILPGGAVSCWGANNNGQVGAASIDPQRSPGAVPGLDGVSGISASVGGTCAVLAAGGIACWGSNFGGELGRGRAPGFSTVPVEVVGPDNDITMISSGALTVTALRGDGALLTWGAFKSPGSRT